MQLSVALSFLQLSLVVQAVVRTVHVAQPPAELQCTVGSAAALGVSTLSEAIANAERHAGAGRSHLRAALRRSATRGELRVTVFGTSMTYGLGCAIMNKDVLEGRVPHSDIEFHGTCGIPEMSKPRPGWPGRLQQILESWNVTAGHKGRWAVKLKNLACSGDRTAGFVSRFSHVRSVLEATDLVIMDYRINDGIGNSPDTVKAIKLLRSLTPPPAILFLETFGAESLFNGIEAARSEGTDGQREAIFRKFEVPAVHYIDIDLQEGGSALGARGAELWPAGDNPSRSPPITNFMPHPTCVVHQAIADLLAAVLCEELRAATPGSLSLMSFM
eukprot:TRINITY_DN12615_c0_g1_i1.p1 TRINITY_DN12615_c0_g1~~TRINITY_DN12615_c0_g1_i1.p1  ORF type:complete len:330 (+),score=53.84 TRINITY_DN12615_c0_g1_i1:182-1171(+)